MLHSLWLNNTMYFGLRGRHEHSNMCWGDIELHHDSKGAEFLMFTERATKTRQGGTRLTRAFQPKMFATGIRLIAFNLKWMRSAFN